MRDWGKAGSGQHTTYWKINEALCSSCNLKPRKFQVRQENMMASMRKRGCYSFLPYKVFLGPQIEEVDTVPRFIRIYRSSLGLSDHENF